jgi:hypothetical protein
VNCGLIRLDLRVDTINHVVELVPLSVEQWSANATGRFSRHCFNLLPGIM